MPFDTLTMAAVADEIGSTITAGRVQKIIQPSATAVGLAVYRDGIQNWVLLSADAQYARAHLSSDRLAKAFAEPSAFVMLLRKYLDGARVMEVLQVHEERILTLTCMSSGSTVRLLAEVMGKHSNVILVDANDRVLGALKVITTRHSRVRPVLPGHPYSPPPHQARDHDLFSPGPRIDPCKDPLAFETTLFSAPPTTRVQNALRGLLPGASTFLVSQIAIRAGLAPDAPLHSAGHSLLAAAGELYGLYSTRAWRPHMFADARGRIDFASFAPLGVKDIQAVVSMSSAIERCMGSRESKDVLQTTRNSLLATIERQQRAATRRLQSLRENLEAAEDAEEIMQQGQMLLAYQYAIPLKATEFAVPDMDMKISLDPTLSAVDNAERLFHRYRKRRDAQCKLPELIESAEADIARLDDLAVFVRLALSEADLRDLKRELEGAPASEKSGKKTRQKRRGPVRLTWQEYPIIMGRNAHENEEVTFRVAHRDDLWLHARQRTGAHVVLQTGRSTVPEEVVEAAARLAAYHSEARHDTRVDVDVTQVRNVRKLARGAPGRVNYSNFRTVRVEPSDQGWRKV